MEQNKLKEKLQELINASTLGHDERKFIFDVNAGKIKLDFLEHSAIVKEIKSKQKAFEDINNPKEMMEYIDNRIDDIESEISFLEDQIREQKNTKDKYKEILKTLNLMK